MDRTKGVIAAVAGFCLLWAMILLMTTVTVYNMAGDKALLSEQMFRCAPPDVSGLPEGEYPEMGRMIAEFLTGRSTLFQYSYTDPADPERKLIDCFQPHEVEHMVDCRGLIHRTGVLRWIFGGALLVLGGAGIALRKYWKSFASGMRAGFVLFAAAFGILLIWGIADFGGLFTCFHRVVFTNDGWLLNPETDMLIRLMPTSFFVNMGVRLLLCIIAAAGVGGFLAKAIRIKGVRGAQ